MEKYTTEIFDLRVENLLPPCTVDVPKPRFSWKMRSDVLGQRQKSFQIVVKDGERVVWDSDVVVSDLSVDIAYDGEELASSTSYAWELTVYDGSSVAHTASSTFDTGIGGRIGFESAGAIYISADCEQKEGVALRKVFRPSGKISSAKLYTTGLGVYESFINGERVGALMPSGERIYHELKPGFSEVPKRQYYSSFDVTDMIDETHDNTLSAMLGSGWWSGDIMNGYGKKNAYLALLLIKYEDGSVERVVTDLSWRSACASPITYADIFNGECYDARIGVEWMRPDFDESNWGGVVHNEEFCGKITAWVGSPITVHHELERAPISAVIYSGAEGATDERYGRIKVVREYSGIDGGIELSPDEVLLIDFGQNFAGWEKISVSGERGTKLCVRHGETLNDNMGEKSRGNDGPGGSVYNANYRAAKASTEYILSGDGVENYHPSLSFFGFRYIEIRVDKQVKLYDAVGEVVSSVEQLTGFMETSDKKINRLIENVRWGQLSNYLSVPTDCPQRDERQGWTGDTQAFASAGCYMGFSESFLEKFMYDLRDTQNDEGAYPGTAPTGRYNGGHWGGTGWADAGVIVPYTLYTLYGDKRVIEDSWESMEKYVDGFLGKTELHGPLNVWGDWLAYESNDDEIQSMIAAAYYAWDAQMMAEMAAAIGKLDDIAKYKKVAALVKENFAKKYVNEDGTLRRPEQSVCLYALYVDMLPSDRSREAVMGQLISNFERTGNRLQTGFLGTKIILDTLTKIGRNDIAYSLLLQEKNPSWLYSVLQGATTIWERWNSYTIENGFGDVAMNSFNHYAYGAVASWMFRTMAGFNADPVEPGFKHAIISPMPDTRIPSVDAKYNSAYGLYTARSELTDSTWSYSFALPANTSARIVIPTEGFASLTVNGKTPESLEQKADGIVFVGCDGGIAYFDAVAGSFDIVCTK